MKLRALIVEDCEVMRNLLMQMLRLTGLAEFKFIEAKDGADAWAKFDPKHTDIIFADWIMPRLSGTDLVRKLRASGMTDHIPIIMVTAQRTVGHAEEAIDRAGADVCITKPYTIAGLRRQLQPVIERIAQQRRE